MELQLIFWALCLLVAVPTEAAHLKASDVVTYGDCPARKSNTNYPMSSRQRRATTYPQFVTPAGITGATTCGPIQAGSSKIVGGDDASSQEYPFMVALVLTSDNSQQCGGSLVTDDWVLTAAHCFVKDDPNNEGTKIWDNKLSDWKFRVKVNDLNTNNGATLEADTIVIHPNYKLDGSSNDDDVAMVRLCSSVTGAGVVCLPDFDPAPAYHQQTCTVIGWGKTSETGSQSNTLKEVDVTVTDPGQSSCSDTKDTVCAAASGKDSCQGDSGGPLICKVSNNGVQRWAQVGVVSYGTGDCAQAGHYGIYGNVNKYKTWITDTINNY